MTVSWSGGWCSICEGNISPNNNYSCQTGSGSFNWNNGQRNFNDPLPANSLVSRIDVKVNKVNCGLNNICVQLNGQQISCTNTTGNCGCFNCFPTCHSNTNVNYNYGGSNTIKLIPNGNVCVHTAEITIHYAGAPIVAPCPGPPPPCPPAGWVSITPASPSLNCLQDCVDLTAHANATAPYTYAWNTGANTQTITVCPSVTSNFSVTVTDAKNCTESANVTVDVSGRCGDNIKNVWFVIIRPVILVILKRFV